MDCCDTPGLSNTVIFKSDFIMAKLTFDRRNQALVYNLIYYIKNTEASRGRTQHFGTRKKSIKKQLLLDFNDFLHEFLNNFVLTENVKFEGKGCFYLKTYLLSFYNYRATQMKFGIHIESHSKEQHNNS